jgi:hypothetical protein
MPLSATAADQRAFTASNPIFQEPSLHQTQEQNKRIQGYLEKEEVSKMKASMT